MFLSGMMDLYDRELWSRSEMTASLAACLREVPGQGEGMH